MGTLIEISALISELSPGKGAFAVAAAHKTFEGIIAQIPFGILLAAPDNSLSQLKLILADNGFVHSLNNNPVFLILSDALS